MKPGQFKTDRYRQTRGGHSRFLDVVCAKCEEHVCFYQKDGPGMLKRMYVDRMIGKTIKGASVKSLPNLTCTGCKELLGVPMIYKKETRLAYRLFVGAVAKKVVKGELVNE